jgi:predicted nucleic acid-binding protein
LEDRRILIDTSVVIDHFRKKNKQKSLLYELSKENTLFLSAISKFEFLVGAKPSQIRQTETIIEGFYILSFNSNVADIASDIAKKLKTINKIIEFRDIFIAATAIANNMPLSTLNVKHFKRIDDLELLDPKNAAS